MYELEVEDKNWTLTYKVAIGFLLLISNLPFYCPV